jgi:hypothetical protein
MATTLTRRRGAAQPSWDEGPDDDGGPHDVALPLARGVEAHRANSLRGEFDRHIVSIDLDADDQIRR